MNTVKSNITKHEHVPAVGDIFKSEDGEFYILAKAERDRIVAVCLHDGERWNDGPSIQSAIRNLEFVGQNCKITIDKS